MDVNGLIDPAFLRWAAPLTIIFVAILLTLLFVRLAMRGGENKQALAAGQTAQAAVLKMWDTGWTVNGNPRIGVLLEVRPPGGAPFQVEVQKVISRLQTSQYQPGQMLEVKYDPVDHKKVAIAAILDGASMAGNQDNTAQIEDLLRQAQQLNERINATGKTDTAQLDASLLRLDELNEQIIATGQPAQASVLLYQPMGVLVNGNNPFVTLNLEVRPADRDPFMAQAQGFIAEQSVPRYQPGSIIYVRYDPNNITRVAIDHS